MCSILKNQSMKHLQLWSTSMCGFLSTLFIYITGLQHSKVFVFELPSLSGTFLIRYSRVVNMYGFEIKESPFCLSRDGSGALFSQVCLSVFLVSL